jgi:hypothetical protein
MTGPIATTVRFTFANLMQLRAGGLMTGPGALFVDLGPLTASALRHGVSRYHERREWRQPVRVISLAAVKWQSTVEGENLFSFSSTGRLTDTEADVCTAETALPSDQIDSAKRSKDSSTRLI